MLAPEILQVLSTQARAIVAVCDMIGRRLRRKVLGSLAAFYDSIMRRNMYITYVNKSKVDMQLNRNSLIISPTPSQIKLVRQSIRNRVMIEYQPEFEKAVGWRRYLVKWKLNAISESRYRGILFMGAAASLPEDFNPEGQRKVL